MKFGTIVAWVCGAVFATGTLLIGSSYLVGHEFEIERDEATVLMQSMREQMFADMMHDTMRGVVYRSLYAASIGDAARPRTFPRHCQVDRPTAITSYRCRVGRSRFDRGLENESS